MKTRRFSVTVAFGLLLCLVLAFVVSSLMKTGAAAPLPPETSAFKTKFVVVQMDHWYRVALVSAHVRQLGGRSFLVGKGSDGRNTANWTNGRIVWVPMDRITEIVEFETEAEMKKAWTEYEKMELRLRAVPAVPE